MVLPAGSCLIFSSGAPISLELALPSRGCQIAIVQRWLPLVKATFGRSPAKGELPHAVSSLARSRALIPLDVRAGDDPVLMKESDLPCGVAGLVSRAAL